MHEVPATMLEAPSPRDALPKKAMRRFSSPFRTFRTFRSVRVSRFTVMVVCGLGVAAIFGGGSSLLAACTTSADDSPRIDDSPDGGHRDGAQVEAPDGGVADAGLETDAPTCAAYCASVMMSCTGDVAQYSTPEECMAFCALLPAGTTGESKGDSVACRDFYAGSAARTDNTYCAAAGPFGGGTCGDRCPIFCELTLAACNGGGEGGPPPYASYSDCQTACVGYGYVDGGIDGGGEPLTGPESGNTLNCRLFYLRQALSMDQNGCENLATDSPACK